MRTILIVVIISTTFLSCTKVYDRKNGYANVNGTSIFYEVAGKGTPLILIHGNFGDRRHWDYQVEPLSKQFKVIRYDVRGYGKSALPLSDVQYSDREDLKALLQYLEINKAHICGLSRGNAVAVDFALAYPEMCYSLISVGPWVNGYGAGDFKSPNADSLYSIMPQANSLLKSKGPKAITDFIWKGNNCLARSIIKQPTLDSLLKMGYDYSYWSHLNKSKIEWLTPSGISRLKEITIPTLIITSEYDLEASKEIANLMAKEISGSKMEFLKNAGHIMNMDKPEEFNKIISDFINPLKRE